MFEHVKTVRLFSAPFNCPYCDRAKKLLKRFDIAYTEIIGVLPPGTETYPQIFFDDEYVGGCDNLFQLARDETFRLSNES